MSPSLPRRTPKKLTDALSGPPDRHACFAIAAPGLEPLVARELVALGVMDASEVAGGVEFHADDFLLATAHLQLRIASRVLVRLASFRATAFHELERAARQVVWTRVLAPSSGFRLRVTCRKSRLYHSDAVAERVAAAIVRGVSGAEWRESVEADADADDESSSEEEHAPQLFVVRLDRDRCTISADASGALLHRRGYRQAVGRAPLRETLAAAMLAGAGWDPRLALLDPMCGSGTIPIEAAMIARRIPPGLSRGFAAEQWPISSAQEWERARGVARSRILPNAASAIHGSDRDAGAIEAAHANATRAGVAADIEFRVLALSSAEPAASEGLLISNPPYGIRVGESAALRDLFARLGQLAHERFGGWRIALLSADPALDRQTRLAFEMRFRTNNGGIPVRLVTAHPAISTRSLGQ